MLEENKIICPKCGTEIYNYNLINKYLKEIKSGLKDLLENNNKQQEYIMQDKYLHDKISMKEQQIKILKQEIETKIKELNEKTKEFQATKTLLEKDKKKNWKLNNSKK